MKWWRREWEFGGRREAVMTMERKNGFFFSVIEEGEAIEDEVLMMVKRAKGICWSSKAKC